MRIALGVEYDGTDFLGWQRLRHGRTVQGCLEAALASVAGHPVQVFCAGRTDSGVHARCQVIHFDTIVYREPRQWVLGACSNLPRDVAVLWAKMVSDDFHARFCAYSRRYRYSILNRPIRAVLHARYMSWERLPLDVESMHRAAQALVGEHDFSAFRAISCQASHARRCVLRVDVSRYGEEVWMDIEANAFLHHMVRNIVGSLLPIGRGERPVAWMAQLLAGRDRKVAGPTALPQGLSLTGPRYDSCWGLPQELRM